MIAVCRLLSRRHSLHGRLFYLSAPFCSSFFPFRPCTLAFFFFCWPFPDISFPFIISVLIIRLLFVFFCLRLLSLPLCSLLFRSCRGDIFHRNCSRGGTQLSIENFSPTPHPPPPPPSPLPPVRRLLTSQRNAPGGPIVSVHVSFRVLGGPSSTSVQKIFIEPIPFMGLISSSIRPWLQ